MDAVKRHGGLHGVDLGLANAFTYTISSDALAALANEPDVKYISPNRTLHGSLEFANPTVNADLAFKAGYSGSTNSTIAIIDSGVTNHLDLRGLGGTGRLGRVGG